MSHACWLVESHITQKCPKSWCLIPAGWLKATWPRSVPNHDVPCLLVGWKPHNPEVSQIMMSHACWLVEGHITQKCPKSWCPMPAGWLKATWPRSVMNAISSCLIDAPSIFHRYTDICYKGQKLSIFYHGKMLLSAETMIIWYRSYASYQLCYHIVCSRHKDTTYPLSPPDTVYMVWVQ